MQIHCLYTDGRCVIALLAIRFPLFAFWGNMSPMLRSEQGMFVALVNFPRCPVLLSPALLCGVRFRRTLLC